MLSPSDIDLVTTLDVCELAADFLRITGITLTVGAPRLGRNPDGKAMTIYPVTFNRGAQSITLDLFPESLDEDALWVWTEIDLVLSVKTYPEFCRWRMRERIPLKEIAAEWQAYQALKRPILGFFTTEELEVIKLGLM